MPPFVEPTPIPTNTFIELVPATGVVTPVPYVQGWFTENLGNGVVTFIPDVAGVTATLFSVSATTLLNPTFGATVTAMSTGDIVRLQVQAAGGNWSAPVVDQSHTIIADESLANTLYYGSGALTNATAYEARANINSAGWSNVLAFTTAADAAPTTAFLARAFGLSAAEKTAYLALINGLAASTIWNKLDALYITATNAFGATPGKTARLNLVSTSFNLTNLSQTPNFVVDRGFTTIDNGLSSLFTPSSSSGKYLLNDGHLMVWSNTTGGSGDATFGTVIGSGSYISTSANGVNTNMAVNGGNVAVGTTPTGAGFYLASRASSANFDAYWNNNSLGNKTSASTSLSTGALALGSQTGQGNGAKQISAASIGGSLTSGEAATYYTLMRAYMTAVGVA